MLEIESHKYLKKFVKSQGLKWQHIYSFGRIVSKCLQTKENYLINSLIFHTQEWFGALLISLFLYKKDSMLVLSKDQIHTLKETYLPLLKEFGFSFHLNEDEITFQTHKICCLTYESLVNNFCDSSFTNKRIILSGSENLRKNLKYIFHISLFKKDWFSSFDFSIVNRRKINNTYDYLKRSFFNRAVPEKNYVYLDKQEIELLRDFLDESLPTNIKFYKVKLALNSDWACWVSLDYDKFEWILHLEPIDELNEIGKLFKENSFIFLSASRNDNFLGKYIKEHKINLDLIINFKSNYVEKNFLIYVPSRQIIPNNPVFHDLIYQKCQKLILLRKGLNIVLIDEKNLKIDLATKLASEYGKKVFLENISEDEDTIICASFSWWINHLHQFRSPKQIIVPLLPIPNLSDPINSLTVSYIKRQGGDWFRDFLLIEAFQLLDRSIEPLRMNSGKLVILDGRTTSKQWGRDLLRMLQPSKVINYKFPFE